jgi:2-phosphosulfolactate phosphatase
MKAPNPVYVHFLPELIPAGALEGCVAVVVDVLRATTCMVHAIAVGVRAIHPVGEIDEARALAAQFSHGECLLGGERQGLPIDGFDFGNSPTSYTPERCANKRLVITTTNGTRAILASLPAARVLIAAFPNALATSVHLVTQELPIHLICSGTDGKVSLEDTALAGYFAAFLLAQGAIPGNDESVIAAGLWESIEAATARGESLASRLALGRGGRRVREIGLAADLEDAARRDWFPSLIELQREPLRLVRVD